jgi:integrase
MKEVQDRLGHSKITTTMDVYAHTTKQTRKKTADLFDMVSGQLL